MIQPSKYEWRFVKYSLVKVILIEFILKWSLLENEQKIEILQNELDMLSLRKTKKTTSKDFSSLNNEK